MQNIQTNLFSVILPQITKTKQGLIATINELQPLSKSSLYLLYSEFFLRSKHNQSYATVLLESNLLAVDGKGVLWALDRINNCKKPKIIVDKNVAKNSSTYKKWQYKIASTTLIKKLFYSLDYVSNTISAFWFMITKSEKTDETSHKIKNILGRDLVYDLMAVANDKNWKVAIVGANLDQAQKTLQIKYSQTLVVAHSLDTNCKIMKDGLGFDAINRDNLLEMLPDLEVVKEFIKAQKPDLILVCFGGTSGKQEFFIDNLKCDPSVSFGLAVGVGAALDHFGGGKKQKQAPICIQKTGLEALWRVFLVPRRAKRILESVFGLIEYVTKLAKIN